MRTARAFPAALSLSSPTVWCSRRRSSKNGMKPAAALFAFRPIDIRLHNLCRVCYFCRLLLEWGRLTDDRREQVGLRFNRELFV